MKICKKCGLGKNFDMFYKRTTSKDGLQSYCKDCRKIVDSESYLQSEKRRSQIRENSNKLKTYNKKLLRRYKKLCKCALCSESEPVALDLHHRNPKEKDSDPSSFVSYSTETLKAEIRKCVVVCSNCHRKIHAGLVQLVE